MYLYEIVLCIGVLAMLSGGMLITPLAAAATPAAPAAHPSSNRKLGRLAAAVAELEHLVDLRARMS